MGAMTFEEKSNLYWKLCTLMRRTRNESLADAAARILELRPGSHREAIAQHILSTGERRNDDAWDWLAQALYLLPAGRISERDERRAKVVAWLESRRSRPLPAGDP